KGGRVAPPAWRKRDNSAPARHPLPGEHGGYPVAERAGAETARHRREARRLRALPPPPRGRRLARPHRRSRPAAAKPVAGIRPARSSNRPLPLLLRAHARAKIPAIWPLTHPRQAFGDALPRLRHSREDTPRARLDSESRRADRRLVRRAPLGAGRRGRAARDRSARLRPTAFGPPRPSRRRPRPFQP